MHWSALGDDWEEDATGRSVAERMLADLVPGAIVLLHDSRRAKPMNPEPVTGRPRSCWRRSSAADCARGAVSEIM